MTESSPSGDLLLHPTNQFASTTQLIAGPINSTGDLPCISTTPTKEIAGAVNESGEAVDEMRDDTLLLGDEIQKMGDKIK